MDLRKQNKRKKQRKKSFEKLQGGLAKTNRSFEKLQGGLAANNRFFEKLQDGLAQNNKPFEKLQGGLAKNNRCFEQIQSNSIGNSIGNSMLYYGFAFSFHLPICLGHFRTTNGAKLIARTIRSTFINRLPNIDNFKRT